MRRSGTSLHLQALILPNHSEILLNIVFDDNVRAKADQQL
jgi:hypothetical protein